MIRVLQVSWDDTDDATVEATLSATIHIYDSADEYIERIGLWIKGVLAKGRRHQVVLIN